MEELREGVTKVLGVDDRGGWKVVLCGSAGASIWDGRGGSKGMEELLSLVLVKNLTFLGEPSTMGVGASPVTSGFLPTMAD